MKRTKKAKRVRPTLNLLDLDLEEEERRDRRRRQVLSAAMFLDLAREYLKTEVERPLTPKVIRDQHYALQIMLEMNDTTFQEMFRLPKNLYYELLGKIRDKIEPSERGQMMAINSNGYYISAETRLACTLRWLAGGSYHDISLTFGISSHNFYQANGVLWPTLEAIEREFVISFPSSNDELENISKGFSKFSHDRINGCVLAVDGILIRTRVPSVPHEVQNSQVFYTRNDCYGIVIIAGCDADCRFRLFSGTSPGSTHDSEAWVKTSLCQNLFLPDKLPSKFFAIADDSFTNTNNMLTPFFGHDLNMYEDSFNYHLCAMRQCIERAIRILKTRFGILWRPLSCSFERWNLVLQVCAKLHNYIIDNGVSNEFIHIHDLDIQQNDELSTEINQTIGVDVEDEEGDRIIQFQPNRRDDIVRDLENQGIVRPPVIY